MSSSPRTVGIARRCELDFVKLQVRASCFAEAFGAVWRFSGSASLPPVMEQPGGQGAQLLAKMIAGRPDPTVDLAPLSPWRKAGAGAEWMVAAKKS